MLTHLQVRDFAIVDQLELELQPGMTALTGETGAGKSILVDALGLVLGDRGDPLVVREGAKRADISARFDVSGLCLAREWLRERDLDTEDECLLRRVVAREGRSRAYVNGTGVPLQALRELGALLIDIHGQHEHQSLLKPEQQRQLLDDFADNAEILAEVQACHKDWRRLRDELQALREDAGRPEAELDFLRFQIAELKPLGLSPEELHELDGEHRRLANAERLLQDSHRILTLLSGDDDSNVMGLLNQAASLLEALGNLDDELGPVGELLTSAGIQVDEAVDQLRHYGQRVDLDPQRLQEVERRLGLIHELARKHRVEAEGLPALLGQLEADLDRWEHSEARLLELAQTLETRREAYSSAAARLSRSRKAAAATLGTQVSAAMADLGMVGGRFEVSLSALDGEPRSFGDDAVEFLVAANKGQTPRALRKVASGGELSRISLAIQVITANAARIPSLVFDEVDTGIGGGIAAVVGELLRRLGEQRQVLTVTHLPQVAARAHHHLQVRKQGAAGGVRTAIEPLPPEQRVREIARMLGGMTVTSTTLDHAREMMAGADAS